MLEEMKLKDILNVIEMLNYKIDSSTKEDGRYCIVRTYSAGVFAGNIESKNGREVTLTNARRLWKWSGAASLSQLAMEGVKDPNGCKFPREVSKVILTEVIEILDCTNDAQRIIKDVPIWEV